MLAKKTVKKPNYSSQSCGHAFRGVDYFDVSTDGECIVLRPLQWSGADEVRARLAQLGISEADAEAAAWWVRKRS